MNIKLYVALGLALAALSSLTGCTVPVNSGGCTTTSCPDPTVRGEDTMITARTASGGWSQNGKLTDLDPMGAVTLQANFPEAGAYSVQFAIDDPDGAQVLTEAVIQWSVEGNTISRRVSVVNGVTVSGVGQAVRISVKDVDPPQMGVVSQGTYGVSIQVSKGTRAASSQAPILTAFNPVNGSQAFLVPTGGLGTAVTVPVPNDAGAIAVGVTVAYQSFAIPPNGTPIPETVPMVLQRTASDFAKSYDPRDPGSFWVPLATGCKEILLANNGTQDLIMNVVFEIDG